MIRREGETLHSNTLASRVLVCLLPLLILGGCASSGPRDSGNGLSQVLYGDDTEEVEEEFSPELTRRTADPLYNSDRVVLDDVVDPLDIYDPLEPFNRAMYSFNAQLDRKLLLPVIRTYRRIIPGFARQGVTNFFDNLDDIRTGINQILQLRPKGLLQTTGRFIINTTLGIAGLWDPASRISIPKHDEDFGQTLGYYGVKPGPYLVLPLFGPSSVRDGVGRVFDAGSLAFIDPLDLNGHSERGFIYYPLLVIDTRATTAFEYFSTGSPFEYELVRTLYIKKRELDIAK
ncbi:VacJ family lipoprotein [bacterium]|nr:VacJ family lipoprotein [bacterium]